MDFANQSRLTRAAFILFLFTVALLPVGFGGARPLPMALLQISTAISLMILLCDSNFFQKLFLPQRLRWALGGFMLVLSWGVIQTLPFVPTAWQHPFWQETATALGQPVKGGIALDHAVVWQALGHMVTYGAVLFMAYVWGRDTYCARRMLVVFFSVACMLALYGLWEYFSSDQMLFWQAKWAYENDVTGSFVNRNHFAVYMGLAFLCGFGLLIQPKETTDKHVENAAYSFGLLILAVALLYTHSRAGLVCAVAGVGVFVAAYLFYQRRFALAILGPALFVILTATALYYGHSHIGRFATLFSDYSSQDRLEVYKLSAQAIQASPWFGYGLGNFEPAFQFFRTDTVGRHFDAAHSDWLESIFDLGIPAALLLWAVIAILLSGCFHGVRTRRRSGLYPALGLGGSALILAHALVDFSLQIPALVVFWLCMLGIGLAQGWSSTLMGRHD